MGKIHNYEVRLADDGPHTVQLSSKGGFCGSARQLSPYGLQQRLPEKGCRALSLNPTQQTGRYALCYLENEPYGLESGEVVLYSEYGQVIYYNKEGYMHLTAKKFSMASGEEDLYSLLKDLLDVVKGLQTGPIETVVNGGSIASPIPSVVRAQGVNAGVGLAPASQQKVEQLAQRLEKLLALPNPGNMS